MINPEIQKRVEARTRRHFFRDCGVGIGKIALASLLAGGFSNSTLGTTQDTEPNRDNPIAPRPPHFAPKAKRVIYLFMAGAPSHLDLFDYKPKLEELEG